MHNIITDISDWALWNGKITEFKMYNSVNSGSLVIDTMEFISSATNSTYTVTIEQEGNGILNYESGTCFDGQDFSLSAIAEVGWGFQSWTGDITDLDNPLEITVNADMLIKAVFKEVFKINLISENGFVKKFPDQAEYLKGQSVQLIPLADYGYRFSDWTGDFASSNDTINIVLDSTINLSSNFEAIPGYSLNITATNGYVDRVPYATSYEQGTSVELSVREKNGYRFAGWTGDVVSSDNTITVNMDSTINLTANFEMIIYYTLTVIQEHGYVLKNPTRNKYEEGEIVTLESVTADEGYEFTGWSGDTTGMAIPLVLIMDSNITITANFKLINVLTDLKSKRPLIYPNPGTNGVFTFNENENWSVFTNKGLHILSGDKNVIDISKYPPGVYFLKIKEGIFTIISQ